MTTKYWQLVLWWGLWGITGCCNCIVPDWCSSELNQSQFLPYVADKGQNNVRVFYPPLHIWNANFRFSYLEEKCQTEVFLVPYCWASCVKCKLKIPFYFLEPNERKTQLWWVMAKNWTISWGDRKDKHGTVLFRAALLWDAGVTGTHSYQRVPIRLEIGMCRWWKIILMWNQHKIHCPLFLFWGKIAKRLIRN